MAHFKKYGESLTSSFEIMLKLKLIILDQPDRIPDSKISWRGFKCSAIFLFLTFSFKFELSILGNGNVDVFALAQDFWNSHLANQRIHVGLDAKWILPHNENKNNNKSNSATRIGILFEHFVGKCCSNQEPARISWKI